MSASAAAPGGRAPVKKLTIKTLKKPDANGFPSASGSGAASATGSGGSAVALSSGSGSSSVLESTWATLADFIAAVHGTRASDHSFQELYSAVESLVLARHGPALYDRVTSQLREHVIGVMDAVAASAASAVDDAVFLVKATGQWASHCEQVVVIRNVFLYLDRTHVRDTPGARPLWDQGVHLFREALAARPAALARVASAFVALVGRERRGETVDRPTLALATRMLTTLRLYGGHLEPVLVAATRDHYASDGVARMASLPVPEYCVYVEQRLRDEVDRVRTYCEGGSLRHIVTTVEEQLIAAHATALIDRGFGELVASCRSEDLARMYSLLARVGRTEEMRKTYQDLLKKRAAALVSDEGEEKDKRIVDDLLAFRNTMHALVVDAFACNDGFAAALKSAIELAVNARDGKLAELIAKYVDAIMRQGTRVLKAGAPAAGAATGGAGTSSSAAGGAATGGASSSSSSSAGAASSAAVGGGGGGGGSGSSGSSDLDALLDTVMVLFRCIHGKDVFEAFYKKDLAKRLLLGKSANSDLERGMVSRLKTECGSVFTSKLEGMFKDADLSKLLMGQFATSPFLARAATGIDVHVLTASYWPHYQPAPAIVPDQLQPSLDAFAGFYATKYSEGRRLAWQHQLGYCIVKAQFPSGRKELEVSFFQTLVLLLFNAADALPFTRIKELTGVEDGELRRTLQSLALGKARVLRKEPKGKEVGDADVFTWNKDFTDPLIRIKINTIQAKETKAEVDATHEAVQENRQYQIDAALVRIMKSRKTLTHQSLMAEVFAQLRFPAKAPDVKKRIESLIERDYMERDDADANTYRYVA